LQKIHKDKHMENKIDAFFSENNFDFQELHSGHLKRFERKLNQTKKNAKTSWKWLSAAASIILVFGFWLGSNHQKKQMDLADISPKMEEVQNYFVSTIHQELKVLEKNRSLETEVIIEGALEQLEELEDSYKAFVKELNIEGNSRQIISEMIQNYQQRLEILENVLKQIEEIKNLNLLKDEIYI
jgi:phosphopantetheine adenylyltransferase